MRTYLGGDPDVRTDAFRDQLRGELRNEEAQLKMSETVRK